MIMNHLVANYQEEYGILLWAQESNELHREIDLLLSFSTKSKLNIYRWKRFFLSRIKPLNLCENQIS